MRHPVFDRDDVYSTKLKASIEPKEKALRYVIKESKKNTKWGEKA